MMPLLAASAFDGTWVDAARAGASWVGEARFDGYLLVSTLPRDAVEAALPPGWRLAPTTSADTARHPIVLAAGRQHQTAVLFGGLSLPTDADYDEVMVAVPFVCRERESTLHVWVPRMFCGDARATWSGNTTYGLGKVRGGIERLGNVVVVTDSAGTLHLQMLIGAVGGWKPLHVDGENEGLAELCRPFSLPVVGRRFDAVDVVSYFDWNLTRAVVRPIEATVTFESFLALGVTPNTDAAASRGYEVRGMRWRLSWPLLDTIT